MSCQPILMQCKIELQNKKHHIIMKKTKCNVIL